MVSHQACGLGGCHTNDHLAGNRSRCESLGDVDNITQCREVIVGCAEAGGSNECLAGVDSRRDTDVVVLACAARSASSIAAATAAAA
jgi:hypothetical protein